MLDALTSKLNDNLRLESVGCCLCETESGETVGAGEDFEYRTSADKFTAMQCKTCGLIYLNPRPTAAEFARIYPANYHAFEFSAEHFGFVYQVRRRLEASRLLKWCRGLPDDARILDVGCGDGFHLELLRDFGKKTWTLEGIDADERATEIGQGKNLTIHQGLLETVNLPAESFDLVILIQTVEHISNPPDFLRQIRSLLKTGGKLVIVTDNTDSMDFRLFKARHWGGYHFPRHWNLFNPKTMQRLADKAGFEVEKITTIVSPVNWTYSVRNRLVDRSAPAWLINQFSLKATAALSFFTVFDKLNQIAGRGALLNAILKK